MSSPALHEDSELKGQRFAKTEAVVKNIRAEASPKFCASQVLSNSKHQRAMAENRANSLGEWPTSRRGDPRALKQFFPEMSEREIAARTNMPKSTVHDILSAPTDRRSQKIHNRGRKPLIDKNTVDKKIKELEEGHWNSRILTWKIWATELALTAQNKLFNKL
ncbi:MAG: hypothetical protein M1829_001670 [Trizodia sp. TS-e1964]|nr:MAG: hypothetical protein M1829_001670 [Trizodia sp. TS-e1964]